MVRLFDVALLAVATPRPLVVAFGDARRWRAHLIHVRGCDVVEVGIAGDVSALVSHERAGRIDLVCALDVLHRVREPRAWLRTMAQLLRPGGRLLTTVPNPASVEWWWRTFAQEGAGRPIGRAALIRDHQHVGFLTLAHGYFGYGPGGARRETSRPGAWARAWRRRLAPGVFYLGARVELTTRRALETAWASSACPPL